MQLRMPMAALALAAMAGLATFGLATAGPAHGSSEPTAARAASPTPLLRAHAHNDYLNSSPVTGALGHGFTSLEADVWLHKDPTDQVKKLMLCHMYSGDTCFDDRSPAQSVGALPFKSIYLDGLRTWVNGNGGRIYPDDNKPIYLLVEIKCHEITDSNGTKFCGEDDGTAPGAGSDNNPLNVLDELRAELGPYQPMLYSRANPTGPIQVIVTGGHNDQDYNDPQGGAGTSVRKILLTHDLRHDGIYLDGLLSKDSDLEDQQIPLVSFEYPATNGCGVNEGNKLNPGSPPRTTTDTVDKIVNAHTHKLQVRVWGLPDCPARGGTDDPAAKAGREEAWNDAKFAGVDYISSNHLQYLQDWLLANYNDPAHGGGDCGDPQDIPPGVHHGDIPKAQFCDLWTANVPVYTWRDPNSAIVGYLVNGGRANWFLGQTQGYEFTYPGRPWQNDWWAWTEADNGAWGWTPVVYFSGGGNDQPADRLISCSDGGSTTCHTWPK